MHAAAGIAARRSTAQAHGDGLPTALVRGWQRWLAEHCLRRLLARSSASAPVRMRASLLAWRGLTCSRQAVSSIGCECASGLARARYQAAWRRWKAARARRTSWWFRSESDVSVWLRALAARRAWRLQSTALEALRSAASGANSRRERTSYALHLRLERQCVAALRRWSAQTKVATAKVAVGAQLVPTPTEAETGDIWGLRLGALLLERLSVDCGRSPNQGSAEAPPPPPAAPASEATWQALHAIATLQAHWRGRRARMERRRLEELRTEETLARAAAEAEAEAAESAATAAHAAAALQKRMRRSAHRSHADLAAAACLAEADWLESDPEDGPQVGEASEAWDRISAQRQLARGWRRWRAAQVVRHARLLRMRAAGDIASKHRRRAGLAALLVHSLNTITERKLQKRRIRNNDYGDADSTALPPAPPPCTATSSTADLSISLSQFA